ncbi:response regulator transcription factor [Rhodococcus sp. BP-349]|uniref:response regulator transcription factor n=1 Tax=unclassified Rhodococcus (in: high G+C Gram-positive bacteria) TaxID=192944 RepID=UPI001C9ADEAF|nr:MULTISPECIES: response regulator transcription factor [unclassified Rhodococcus (in: high G+C Gram-positive bacteria)]MBY6538897.1 response regulator transcription factor [Rhodococcus sp. BP-363]MBY6543234.1 response regulator transcription factor [Rhodococcus sp. BP-369]MBY6562464.1 response regulator transcription factor [Rhodococcus sp. BP-370]MBY6576756.1 response regulator transcription factor [Rhodococcus sp. BP-364]MBY6586057.1 response regulator transcription factor [Rhodococcus sp.
MTEVLLAEDDEAIATPLSRALGREGYTVTVEQTGPAALSRALEGSFDLLILDLGLPGMDGLEVCRQIRATRSDLAVLMLTARTDEVDFVVGLDAGADDYVSKPFRVAELMARVRALLRRRGAASEDGTIEVGGLRLEPAARRVLLDGHEIPLANKEYELLKILLDHAGQVVSRDTILREVWGDAELRGSKTLDMHMSWLRRKIGDEGSVAERRIATVRGVGFRINTD